MAANFRLPISFAKAALLMLAVLAAASANAFERGVLTVLSDGERHAFEVEIADDGEERAQGLMFRREMPRRSAMLFDFGEPRPVSMWMKNTLLPLDMIFAREDGTIVRVASDTTPLSTEAIPSGEPIRYVLEVNAGVSAALGITRGSKLLLPPSTSDASTR